MADLPPLPLPDRITSKIRINEDSGCWEWMAARTKGGYGCTSIDGKRVYVHRLMCALFNGLSDGLTVDHLCCNRACCNPDHLEAVTHRENSIRGNGWGGRNARATHCPHGHEYTPENTYLYRGRQCKTCHKMRNANRLRRAREDFETHCPAGHERSPENIYVSPKGYRGCRICRSIRAKHHRDRAKKS